MLQLDQCAARHRLPHDPLLLILVVQLKQLRPMKTEHLGMGIGECRRLRARRVQLGARCRELLAELLPFGGRICHLHCNLTPELKLERVTLGTALLRECDLRRRLGIRRHGCLGLGRYGRLRRGLRRHGCLGLGRYGRLRRGALDMALCSLECAETLLPSLELLSVRGARLHVARRVEHVARRLHLGERHVERAVGGREGNVVLRKALRRRYVLLAQGASLLHAECCAQCTEGGARRVVSLALRDKRRFERCMRQAALFEGSGEVLD